VLGCGEANLMLDGLLLKASLAAGVSVARETRASLKILGCR
jgi:hypothetical protein